MQMHVRCGEVESALTLLHYCEVLDHQCNLFWQVINDHLMMCAKILGLGLGYTSGGNLELLKFGLVPWCRMMTFLRESNDQKINKKQLFFK